MLRVKDKRSKLKFLVDTGSETSLIPPLPNQKSNPIPAYVAANGTIINKYGEQSLTLDLGLRRDLPFIFVIADVTNPILGADFLEKFQLSVNISGRSITDDTTNQKIKVDQVNCVSQNITQIIKADDEYHTLIEQFPQLTNPNKREKETIHNTRHFIETTGPPVYSKARPLPPDKLKIAKDAFQAMVSAGICRSSKSPYASPLHMVRKSNDECRQCGDYRRLNASKTPDRYPLPRLRDFTSNLASCTHFSKVDLQSAYHQIDMDPDSINKTAVITPFGMFEFLKMPFGLRNASQTFQRFMNEIFHDLPYVFVYVDDLLIASQSHAEHLEHLKIVFTRGKSCN